MKARIKSNFIYFIFGWVKTLSLKKRKEKKSEKGGGGSVVGGMER
jgi:hypothetical protein